MKFYSGRHTTLLCCATLLLLAPASAFCAETIKIPDIIGNVNNPYILPSGGPGFWLSAAIGIVAGLLSASIGAGGGLIVVPALMTTGISGIYAIGSEMFRLFIFSTIQSVRMGFNKRINYPLALYLTIGTSLGGYCGYVVTKSVFFADPAGSDVFISAILMLWLIIYAFIIIPEFKESTHEYTLKRLKAEQDKNTIRTGTREQNQEMESDHTGDDGHKKIEQPQFEDYLYPDEKAWEIAKTIRTIKLPPYIKFPGTLKNCSDNEKPRQQSKKPDRSSDLETIPIIPAVLLSMIGGFFMAMTGSGGVILSFTILTKGFGCIAALVAGTDMARLALSAGYLTLGGYGLSGFINIYCITGLVLGNITGLHLGSKALKQIPEYKVKGLVSLLVMSVIINRVLVLPELLRKAGADIPASLSSAFEQSAMFIMLIGALIFSFWMIFAFVTGLYKSVNPQQDKENTQ